ncbi:serine/threonine-protein kinase [Amnibacterium endophyticum]|uniref:Serine/threonine-protein kinase n=1 Tax=Amnibacterium endophyticum TaxID=2109337 RepID=A0ABW4LBS5_9MICO
MRTLPLLGERYRLGPVVGTGGMGAVHRAWDETFGREVALKVVRSGAGTIEQERLRREAQYLARLDHPNLIAVYDTGSDRGRHGETVWFAMELVHGPDLRRVIADQGRLSTADVARVLHGAAGALGALHDAGVVHRDLKPANVLLTRPFEQAGWEPKLADLGIARLFQADALTMTGQVVGTAAYLSPEQVSGEPIGPASDVYSLGLLALEALTGRVAFPGPVAEAAAARLVRAPEIPGGLDRGWRTLLAAMTARRPADRPTAADVVLRCAALTGDAAPLPELLQATAVMPASDFDLPTEAMDLADRPTTGWSPTLRRRARPRPRRVVLVAAAIAVAAGLAGGGASVIGLASVGATGAAATVQTPAPAQVHRSPTATPTPRPTPSRTATPKPAPTAVPTAQPAVDREPPRQELRRSWRDRSPGELRDLRQRFEERWRDRLRGHG